MVAQQGGNYKVQGIGYPVSIDERSERDSLDNKRPPNILSRVSD